MIDRDRFYDSVRPNLFGRSLMQTQVEGINAILAEWDATYADKDLHWLAYALGTTHHETDKTMQPIEEYGKGGMRLYAKPDPETGCTYYGRGLVQLTWRVNYEKAGKLLGIDLVYHPELALRTDHATKILFRGMVDGWFTGARFDWYFNAERQDWYNARRIINGLDRAELVASYSKRYYQAIRADLNIA